VALKLLSRDHLHSESYASRGHSREYESERAMPKCHLTWLGAAVAAPSRVGRTSTLPESSSVLPSPENWTMRQFGLPPLG